MAIKIRVIVNGYNQVPPLLGNQIIGDNLVLKQGENWVDNEKWDKVKNLPLVQMKMAQRIIIVPGDNSAPIESLVSPNPVSKNSPQIVTEQVKANGETINIPTIQKTEEIQKTAFNPPTIESVSQVPTIEQVTAKTEEIKTVDSLEIQPQPAKAKKASSV